MMLRIRVAFIAAGIGAFLYALRTGNDPARWLGIACVAVAVLLRFLGPRKA